MGLFGGKSYKTSEELGLDACYPKKLPDCLKFVQKTLKKGAPYPGDFTHEKLVVLELNYLLKLNNTKDKAIEYANLLETNIMPYLVKSLEKKRAGDYLCHLPTAYLETLYENLDDLGINLEDEKAAVALVLSYFFIKERTLEIVKNIPEDLKISYEFLNQAKKYHDKRALGFIEDKIDAQIKKAEAYLGKR
ncbi:MAG: hypothetical protein IJB13_00630 [Clostridia bacterium]|nr:hypothetical protein [Clostridia bacterium]